MIKNFGIKKLAKFWQLPWQKKQRLAECTTSLLFAHSYLRWAPTQKKLQALNFSNKTILPAQNPSKYYLEDVTWALDILSRHTPKQVNCLSLALAGYWHLQKKNIPSKIEFGVHENSVSQICDGTIQAHAWLTVGSKIVTGHWQAEQNYQHLRAATKGES